MKRVRADTFGYLQRSFPGVQSKTDLDEAMRAGAAAVLAALRAADAAKYTRSVPKEFIAKNGHDVTPAFLAYAKPLVGDLPPCEVL